MNSNRFSWIPPQHPVIKRQKSTNLAPWCKVDWFNAPADFWWKRAPAPVSNTGVKSGHNGRNDSDAALPNTPVFVDYYSATFKADYIFTRRATLPYFRKTQADTADFDAAWATHFCNWLFGRTGVAAGGVVKGQNGYDTGIALIDAGGVRVGVASFGGEHQCRTMSVVLTGAGCSVVRENNGFALVEDRMTSLGRGACKLKRVDVAIDDINGVFPVGKVRELWHKGFFNSRGRPPKSSMAGDWDTKHGRTYYIGDRSSPVFWRSYEKGHQLGDADSVWVRHEIEIKECKTLVIPFSVLSKPESLFGAVHTNVTKMMIGSIDPASIRVSAVKAVAITVEQVIENAKVMSGRVIRFMRDGLGKSPDEIVDALISDDRLLPRRLRGVSGSLGFELRRRMGTISRPLA